MSEKYSILATDELIGAINMERTSKPDFWKTIKLHCKKSRMTGNSLVNDCEKNKQGPRVYLFSLIFEMYYDFYKDNDNFLPCSKEIEEHERRFVVAKDQESVLATKIKTAKYWSEIKISEIMNFVIKRSKTTGKIQPGSEKSATLERVLKLNKILCDGIGIYDMYAAFENIKEWLGDTSPSAQDENTLVIDDIISALVHKGYIHTDFYDKDDFEKFVDTVSNLKCSILGFSKATKYYVRSLEDLATIYCIYKGIPVISQKNIKDKFAKIHNTSLLESVTEIASDLKAIFCGQDINAIIKDMYTVACAVNDEAKARSFVEEVKLLLKKNCSNIDESTFKPMIQECEYHLIRADSMLSVRNALTKGILHKMLTGVKKAINGFTSDVEINSSLYYSLKKSIIACFSKLLEKRVKYSNSKKLTQEVFKDLFEYIDSEDLICHYIARNPWCFSVLSHNSIFAEVERLYGGILHIFDELREQINYNFSMGLLSPSNYLKALEKVIGRRRQNKTDINTFYFEECIKSDDWSDIIERVARARAKSPYYIASIDIFKQIQVICQCLENSETISEEMKQYIHKHFSDENVLRELFVDFVNAYYAGYDKIEYAFKPSSDNAPKEIIKEKSFAIPTLEYANRTDASLMTARNAIIAYMFECSYASPNEINKTLSQLGFIDLLPSELLFDKFIIDAYNICENSGYREEIYNKTLIEV